MKLSVAFIVVSMVVNIGISDLKNSLPFDGKVRESNDGTSIAYMIPGNISNHASTIEQLPDGTLVVAWFAGIEEEANRCAIVFSRLDINSNQFTSPKTLSLQANYSNQNPVLFYDNTTNILHLFHSHAPFESGESNSEIWHLQSNDGYGYNWTNPHSLFTTKGYFPRNRIINSINGDDGIIFPIYSAAGSSSDQYSIIARSNNNRTYLNNINNWNFYKINNTNYLVQPSIIYLPITYPKLKVFFRDRRAKYIYQATSTNDGYKWEIPSDNTNLPNNNAGIESNSLLSNGIIIVYNDYSGSSDNGYGRTPLTISLSYDDGKTWEYTKNLQVHDDNTTNLNTSVEFSYPSVLQTNDGYIHVTYTYNRQTIKYVKFTENWIKNQSIHSN